MSYTAVHMQRFISVRGVALTVMLFGTIGLVFWLRGPSGEDTWLCVDGKWVPHGAPEAPMPGTPCIRTAESETAPPPLSADSVTQPMEVLELTDFVMKHPRWPAMDRSAIADPGRTLVAVSQAGCALVVTGQTIPEGEDLRRSLEQILSTQAQAAGFHLVAKDIGETTSHIEGDLIVGDRAIHTDQYGYLTSERGFYSVVFIAEKTNFDSVCLPVVAPVRQSVIVK